MKQSHIVVFDLETGGFEKDDNGICEIAMIGINIETLEEIDRYETVIAPYKNLKGELNVYTDSALKTNGLTISKIEKGKEASVVVKDIEEFAKKMKNGSKKPILCGHNIDNFDVPFLEYFLKCFKKDIYKFFDKITIDTITWSRFKWPVDGEIGNFKLGTVCDKVGIDLVDSHSAMPDTEANAKLVINFLQSLRNSSGVFQEIEETKSRVEFKF